MRSQLMKRLTKKNQKGSTAVEFAVIAVILLLILFGILEFGLIFMQEHYVANAAREGVRIGIRANNYNCFTGCTTERRTAVFNGVRDYLGTLYSPADIITNEPTVSLRGDDKVLQVVVEVKNFFPPIISSLATLIPGGGFQLPATISYTAEGEYEDPSED